MAGVTRGCAICARLLPRRTYFVDSSLCITLAAPQLPSSPFPRSPAPPFPRVSNAPPRVHVADLSTSPTRLRPPVVMSPTRAVAMNVLVDHILVVGLIAAANNGDAHVGRRALPFCLWQPAGSRVGNVSRGTSRTPHEVLRSVTVLVTVAVAVTVAVTAPRSLAVQMQMSAPMRVVMLMPMPKQLRVRRGRVARN
ncbi:hypothetical protein B0I08_105138 [Glaciihabitans tibetensis]|uniref:Uncharacterized protein n=1 Tax=Glaciihabitans tibetensis TaxID=1266600 RepID=A0A2T0VCW8_9MICO|nr:hypothetical protein B0I08_105138 [Glaciihabitans tibetensis]